jgi:hypothetical protein
VVRAHFGFPECTVADADELAGWLAGGHPQEERRDELVRDKRWPSAVPVDRAADPGSVERIARPGLHQAEKILTAPILRACRARTSGSP